MRQRRLGLALGLVGAVIVVGTVGYLALGFSFLDALYQTVTTITTVGFREVRPVSTNGKVFTILLILCGVGTFLYTFTVILEALVEGQIREALGRRRMDRKIASMRGHVVICGWGRVGHALARYMASADQDVVIVEVDGDAMGEAPYPAVVGDATDDEVLKAAGIERAKALVAALDTDAANLYVTLSGRTLRPDLFIVARARTLDSEEKLKRAGADRVVNPQAIGGQRMAAFVLHPHVAEFLDVVMHDGSLEFRLEQLEISAGSPLAGQSLRATQIRDQTGALVLAVRATDGDFVTNPSPDTVLSDGQTLIAIGTAQQLGELDRLARPGPPRSR